MEGGMSVVKYGVFQYQPGRVITLSRSQKKKQSSSREWICAMNYVWDWYLYHLYFFSVNKVSVSVVMRNTRIWLNWSENCVLLCVFRCLSNCRVRSLSFVSSDLFLHIICNMVLWQRKLTLSLCLSPWCIQQLIKIGINLFYTASKHGKYKIMAPNENSMALKIINGPTFSLLVGP